MLPSSVFVASFVLTSVNVACAEEFFMATVLYWDLDPYIVSSGDGKTPRGVLPAIWDKGDFYCRHILERHNASFVQYIKVADSSEEFLALLFSNKTNEEILPGNFLQYNRSTLIWGPIITSNLDEYQEMQQRRKLVPRDFMESKELVVVMQRSQIELLNKVWLGIKKCGELIFISLLFAFSFSILLWLLEFRKNEEISNTFLGGYGSSVWCSFVSMSTVGYGDISPTTLFGRIVMMAWVTLGLVLAGVLTATVSNTLSETPDIRGQKITVLKNSVAERVAVKDFNATPVLADSYEEIIENVRCGKAYAAVVNSDIAAARQREFRKYSRSPLTIVATIPAVNPIYVYVAESEGKIVDNVFYCMLGYSNEIFNIPLKILKRHCKIDIVYKPTLLESMQKPLMPTLLGLSVALLLCCAMYEFYLRHLENNKVDNKYLVVEQSPEEIVKEECLKMKRMLRNRKSEEKLGESVFYITK